VIIFILHLKTSSETQHSLEFKHWFTGFYGLLSDIQTNKQTGKQRLLLYVNTNMLPNDSTEISNQNLRLLVQGLISYVRIYKLKDKQRLQGLQGLLLYIDRYL